MFRRDWPHFVAFDVLAVDGRDVRAVTQVQRRVLLERALAAVQPPVHVTPMTRDPRVAAEWLSRFEGAGLDGVIAKPEHGPYEPGKRAMIKVKHARTADCVVAGFRWHKSGKDAVGSLLLGLTEDAELARVEAIQLVLVDAKNRLLRRVESSIDQDGTEQRFQRVGQDRRPARAGPSIDPSSPGAARPLR